MGVRGIFIGFLKNPPGFPLSFDVVLWSLCGRCLSLFPYMARSRRASWKNKRVIFQAGPDAVETHSVFKCKRPRQAVLHKGRGTGTQAVQFLKHVIPCTYVRASAPRRGISAVRTRSLLNGSQMMPFALCLCTSIFMRRSK